MAVTVGLTRYGTQVTFMNNDTRKNTTKTYNGFNATTDARAANQFAQFVRGGASFGDGQTNPGLVGLLGSGYSFYSLSMTKSNNLEGRDV